MLCLTLSTSLPLSFQMKVVAVVISLLFNEHISSPPTCLFRAAHIKEPRKNLDWCCDEDEAYHSVMQFCLGLQFQYLGVPPLNVLLPDREEVLGHNYDGMLRI